MKSRLTYKLLLLVGFALIATSCEMIADYYSPPEPPEPEKEVHYMNVATYDDKTGKPKFVYFKDEICGFAVHLVQK